MEPWIVKGLLPGFIILAAVAVLSLWSVARLQQAKDWVAHTLEVTDGLRDLQSLIADVETGSLGGEGYLEPDRAARQRIDPLLGRLSRLIEDNPDQTKQLELLRPLLARQLEIASESEYARRKGGPRAAFATGEEKRVHDQIRQQVARMLDIENRLLVDRQQRSDREMWLTWWFLVPTGVLSLTLGLAAMAALHRMRQRLLALNTSLDWQVMERTADLAASETKFRTMFEHSPVAYQSLDIQGRFLDVNPRLCELLGYSREELLGKAFDELWHEDIRDLFPKAFGNFVRESRVSNELRLTRKDGRTLSVILEGHIQRDTEGRFVRTHCVLTDISERKQVEETLRRSNEQLQKVLEVETVGVLFWDLNTGCLTNANDAFLDLMGYSRQEIEARELTWQKLTPPEYMDVSRAEVEKFRTTGRVGPYEKEYFHKNGTRQWFVFAGSSLGGNACVEFCVDISERKHAEQRYRALVEAGAQIDWIADADGLVREDMPRWRAYTGQSFEEISGDNWLNSLHPGDRGRAAEVWRRAVAQRGFYEIEYRIRRADGVYRDFWVRSVPIMTGEGNIHQWVGACTDITERKRMEDALKASEQEFHLLAEAMPQIVWATDNNGSNSYFNQQWVKYTGLSLEESHGHGWNAPFHPDDRKRAWDAWRNAVERNDTYSLECRLRRADGVYRWWLVRGVPVADGDGHILKWFGTCTDIHEMKLREDTIRASEERRSFALETIQAGEWELDLTTGTTVRSLLNDRIFGYERLLPEWTYGTFLEHILPRDRERVDGLFRQAVADHAIWDFECRIRRADGEIRWIHVRGQQRTCDSGEPLMTGIVMDVTHRKLAEQSIWEAKERLEVAASAGIVGIWDWHVPEDRLTWDPVMYTLYGLHGEEFGEDYAAWSKTIHPEDRPDVEAAIQAALRGEREYAHEFRVVWSDGSIHHIKAMSRTTHDGQGKPLRMIGINYDQTEQKNIEKTLARMVAERTSELEKVNKHLACTQFAMDRVGIGVLWVDPPTGKLLQANQCSAEMLGYTPEELAGMSVTDIDPGYDIGQFGQEAEDCRRRDHIQLETTHMAKDGRSIPVETILFYFNDPGEASRLIVFMTDITQRKQQEEALIQAKEAAEVATRSKSVFLANMSHEIRTPMNAIVGLTHLLKNNQPTPKQTERLEKIEGAARHLLSIINDILDISKIEAGRMELESVNFPLDAVLDHVQSLIAEQARAKNLAIHVDDDGVPRWIKGDPTRLRQALLNYAGNAVKFTAEGSISLRSFLLGEDDGFLLVRFEVQDTGPGIAPENLSKVFQEFEQVDASTTRKHGGTGLGLSITKKIAHLMGGTAGVDSVPGQGSTFWFTAKLKRGEEMAPLNSSAPQENALFKLQRNHAGARLLLAEDNEINQEIASQLLRAAGLVVEVADDGRQAVDKAQANGYDLILMDMQMPHLSGLEATRMIRALHGLQNVPIVAMTANAFEDDHRACIDAGMDDFLSKPVDPEILYVTLLKWLPSAASKMSGEPRAMADTADRPGSRPGRADHTGGSLDFVSHPTDLDIVSGGQKLGLPFQGDLPLV
ncbi:PAS domain S-box protein [Methylomagnum ishizawai]|uniref:PAS domain S-box protein n=1 Tax=Methylomagnum ishizawai TaxID=1760988 RepID=UPI001C338A71|nr:PAS domain S-box protein [Methylomagnum ishizawai]BBL75787.1 hypothetical protein MishRS11D_28850 [Methylomagnum ishizawai]